MGVGRAVGAVVGASIAVKAMKPLVKKKRGGRRMAKKRRKKKR